MGVVGFASLAMESRDSSAALRPLASGGPRIAPAPARFGPWDGRLPVVEAAVRVDGVCRPAEYGQAARISLEPARSAHVQAMIAKHSDRLLLSHDNGWYAVGEAQKIRPYTYLADTLLPALKKAGVTEAMIHKLTVANPAAAFSVLTA